jgi:hypothetical protein
LGSWASITSDLIAFFRSKNLPVYSKLADALDSMADTLDVRLDVPTIPAIEMLLAIGTRAHIAKYSIDVLYFAKNLFNTYVINTRDRTIIKVKD